MSPPPGIGMVQGLHQLHVRSPAHRQARIPGHGILRVRSDPVDPAVLLPLVESLRSPPRVVELVRHPFRMLDDPTVVVHDVKGSVRSHVDEDGPEPMIRGGQKLRLILNPAGLQGDPALLEDVAVNQVVGRVGHEGGLIVRGGKKAAGIDGDSAGRSEVPDVGQDSMFRVQSDRIDARRMIGDVFGGGGGAQRRVPAQIGSGQDLLADVPDAVQSQQASPAIETQAETTASGNRLQFMRVGPKTEIADSVLQLNALFPAGEPDPGSLVAELFPENNGPDGGLVSQVDPVVQPVARVADRVLRVGQGETGQNGGFDVGPVVSVAVLQIPDVRSIGHQHPIFPTQDSRRQRQPVGEDRAAVRQSVAVGVLQQLHAAVPSRIERVADHFHHVDAALLVDLHGDRILNQGFRGEDLDSEARFQDESLKRFLRAERGAGPGACGEQQRRSQKGIERTPPCRRSRFRYRLNEHGPHSFPSPKKSIAGATKSHCARGITDC